MQTSSRVMRYGIVSVVGGSELWVQMKVRRLRASGFWRCAPFAHGRVGAILEDGLHRRHKCRFRLGCGDIERSI